MHWGKSYLPAEQFTLVVKGEHAVETNGNVVVNNANTVICNVFEVKKTKLVVEGKKTETALSEPFIFLFLHTARSCITINTASDLVLLYVIEQYILYCDEHKESNCSIIASISSQSIESNI